MGEVYRAIDTRLHRPVALKVLRTDKDASATVTEAGGAARLLREARAAAALNHANSVAIYELGEAEGIAYIAMELVIGVTFRRYLGEGSVSLDTKVSWLVDAARALWAAHKAGLVHRDVKPGNIMVSEEGVVKVLDFGLAKPVKLQAKPGEFQTLMGQVLGTPRYMAPEQLEGSPADARADQYALGLTAYELITGVYAGGPLAGIAQPVHERTPSAPRELGQVIARMMARNSRDRFPTMEAAAHALRTCIGSNPTTAPKPAAMPKLDRTLDDDEHQAARRSTSNAPTRIVAVAAELAEPASHAREIQAQQGAGAGALTGKTMPLGVPVPLAVGHHAATQLSSPPQSFNRTMPLARPFSIQPPSDGRPSELGSEPRIAARAPSNPSLPQGAPSGVYSARSEAAAFTGAQRTTGDARRHAGEAPAASGRGWVLIVVLVVAAIATSGVAAWLLR
jgi:serine/threonine protein kinase